MILRMLMSFTLIALFAGCATDRNSMEGPLRVSAEGATVEEAKQQAFRKAVELRVGALILSQRIIVNDDLREKITNFSSGFVDRYDTISIARRAGIIVATFDVWVKDSSIAGALVQQYGQTQTVDGRMLEDSLRSRDTQRAQGSALIKDLTRDWPNNGVRVGPIDSFRFEYTADRNAVLIIPSLWVGYSEQFDKGLREALARVSVSRRSRTDYYIIKWRRSGFLNSLLDGNHEMFLIADSEIVSTLETAFNQRVYLKVDLMSGFRTLASSCIFLDSTGMRGGGEMPRVDRTYTNLRFDINRSLIKDVSGVRVEVVRSAVCEGPKAPPEYPYRALRYQLH